MIGRRGERRSGHFSFPWLQQMIRTAVCLSVCLSSDYGLKDWFDLKRGGNFISPITLFRPNSGSNQPWVQWLIKVPFPEGKANWADHSIYISYKPLNCGSFFAGIALPIKVLRKLSRYGDSVLGSEPGGGQILCTSPDRRWDPPRLCIIGNGSFLGVKGLESGVKHPSPSSARVKETVELYLYFLSVPSWQVNFGKFLGPVTCGKYFDLLRYPDSLQGVT
jgi:hypothetical protein